MALTASRVRDTETWYTHTFTLKSGQVAYEGGMASIDLTSGYVVAGAASATQLLIGSFARSIDASLAAKDCQVNLHRPVHIEWFDNDTSGNAVARANVGAACYILADCQVTKDATDHSIAGRVWDVSSTRGVAVELQVGLQGPQGEPGA